MSRAWLFFALLLPLIAGGLVWGLLRPTVERPNVLLITVDTLRADHLGLYGYPRPTSPNLDALGARGAVFENAFANSNMSAPSHATILTGLYPPAHGVHRNAMRLANEVQTLAETLTTAGYDTGMFVSHVLVGDCCGLDQGFATYELHQVNSHEADHGHPLRIEFETSDRGVFDATIGWIDRRRRRPFFAWMHVQHPHESYDPPGPLPAFVPPAPETEQELRCVRTLDDHRRGRRALGEAELEYVIGLYDAEIAWADAEIGRVLDRLRDAGLDDETIVVVTADHGEVLFDDEARRAQGHAGYLDDVVLRVPLIVRAPGTEPRRVGGLVGLIDLVPTILDLVGWPAPPALPGRSLRPALAAGTPVSRGEIFAFSETRVDARRVGQLALRTPGRKLACRTIEDQAAPCQLFDVERDPAERNDLAGDPRYTDELVALNDRLLAWFDEARRDAAEAREVSAAEDALRRAGYLRDDAPQP